MNVIIEQRLGSLCVIEPDGSGYRQLTQAEAELWAEVERLREAMTTAESILRAYTHAGDAARDARDVLRDALADAARKEQS